MEALTAAATASLAFFVATDLEHGRELWVTDGTKKGTHIVSDLSPGRYSSFIDFIIPHATGVVFGVNFIERSPGSFGSALYFTNGSKGHLQMITSSPNGHSAATPIGLNGDNILFMDWDSKIYSLDNKLDVSLVTDVNFNNAVSFQWGDNIIIFGREDVSAFPDIYTSLLFNPQSKTTTRTNISYSTGFGQLGATSSDPPRVAIVNDRLVFAAFTEKFGAELYTFNNEKDKIKPLKDIFKGSFGSLENQFSYYFDGPITAGSYSYFAAYTPKFGYELWRTDGTPGGTRIVLDSVPGRGSPNNLYITTRDTPFANGLHSGGSFGIIFDVDGRLYVSGGTTNTTMPIRFEDSRGRAVFSNFPKVRGEKFVFWGFYMNEESRDILDDGLFVSTSAAISRVNKKKELVVRVEKIVDTKKGIGNSDMIQNLEFLDNSRIVFSASNRLWKGGENVELWVANIDTKLSASMLLEIYPGRGMNMGKDYKYTGSYPEKLTVAKTN